MLFESLKTITKMKRSNKWQMESTRDKFLIENEITLK